MLNKEEFNRKLSDTFGLALDGEPRFRVVFSDDEVETRIGKFDEYYGDILVRSFTGARECKKYSYLDGMFVLEERLPTFNPELIDKVTYEPIYIFRGENEEPLPLNWDVAMIIINKRLNPVHKPFMTEKMHNAEEERQKQEEIKKNLEYLNVAIPSYERTGMRRLKEKTAILNPLEKKNV